MNLESVVTNSIVSIAFVFASMSVLCRLNFKWLHATAITLSVWIVWIFSINYIARYALTVFKELILQTAR